MTDSIVRIQGGMLSNVASLVVTDLDSAYFKYEIIFSGLRSHTQDSTLLMDLSNDNGSTYGTDYSYRMQTANAASGTVRQYSATNFTSLRIVDTIINDANHTYAGTIDIYSPMVSGSKTTALIRSGGQTVSNDWGVIQLCCSQNNTAQADNAFRIRSNNGSGANNFSMQYVIYGYTL